MFEIYFAHSIINREKPPIWHEELIKLLKDKYGDLILITYPTSVPVGTNNGAIVSRDLISIDKAVLVVVDMTGQERLVGTVCELFYTKVRSKISVVVVDSFNLSPWTINLATVIVDLDISKLVQVISAFIDQLVVNQKVEEKKEDASPHQN